ncbi:PAS/PAC domain-containing protein [Nitrospirillum viridazoti Y2]|uniref:histidine kinase n=1 Tax=Nitrospirillum amazonense TaxID=28077 RepID=A0A560IBG2_9PROT|nr:ATP-binding protein [Nitrospirillum amazonense]EGY01951.1 PAS/PAC domain-containing protein [Nitrospirillum amazonense Y2]TWB56372.1 signal transduction histidine kinase [Nitrospirillum amazonense]
MSLPPDAHSARAPLAQGSITTRLLSILVPLVLLAAAGTAFVAVRTSRAVVERFAVDYGQDLANRQAGEIAAITREKIAFVEGLARQVESMVATGTSDRRLVAKYIERTALAHPNMVGFWFLAEPDFMGPDQRFKDGDPTLGLPESGRFATYYVADGQGGVKASEVRPDFYHDEFYTRPAQSRVRQAIPPYLYTVLGRPVWMISYTVPVIVDGRLIGVAGTDLSLEARAQELDSRRPLGGSIYMINREGNWTYHPDHALLATKATVGVGAQFQLSADELAQVLKVQSYEVERLDKNGLRIRRYAVPMVFFEGDSRRLLLLDVPVQGLSAPFAGIGTAIMLAALAAGLLISLVLVAAVRAIIGVPLTRMARTIDLLDEGQAVAVPDTGRDDQIGGIARALDRFRGTLAERDRLRAQVEERTTALERMLAGVGAAKDAIVLFDRDYTVLYANPAAISLLGAPDEAAVVGRCWPDLLTPETAALSEEGRLRRRVDLMSTGYAHMVSETWESIWGRTMEAYETTLSLRPNGDIVMVLRDVSAARRVAREREELQRQVLQQDKMEAIGRLAGGVAHDFNNLLGAMLGYVEFLLDDLDPQDKAHSYVARINAVGKRAKDLVGQILTFARSDKGELQAVSPVAVLEDARGILRSAVPATTEMSFQIAGSVPNVRANPTQLVQVLMNLVINAHDARRGEGGRIRIRLFPGPAPEDARVKEGHWVEHEALPFDKSRPHVVLEVEDEGHGMTMEVMTRLFEPFFTTKGKGRGTGLGMPVVYGIVRAHGGGMTVMSAEGEGALLRVLLPVGGPGAVTAPMLAPAAMKAVPHRRLRILVVDDAAEMGDMLLEGLSRRGHEVAICETPAEALEVFEENPLAFDAVVSDQTMPGMTGMALIALLKTRRPDLPCVLYTGYSERSDEKAVLAGGADAFFLKPVVVERLAAKVEALCAARPGVSV